VRRVRLALVPQVRARLERLRGAGSRGARRVLRLGSLLEDERARLLEYDRRYRDWEVHHFHRIDQQDIAALRNDQAASQQETERLLGAARGRVGTLAASESPSRAVPYLSRPAGRWAEELTMAKKPDLSTTRADILTV
jgi:hypothetical protein